MVWQQCDKKHSFVWHCLTLLGSYSYLVIKINCCHNFVTINDHRQDFSNHKLFLWYPYHTDICGFRYQFTDITNIKCCFSYCSTKPTDTDLRTESPPSWNKKINCLNVSHCSSVTGRMWKYLLYSKTRFNFDLLYLICYKCIPSYNMLLDLGEDI